MYLDKFKSRFRELEYLFLGDKSAYNTKLIPCTKEEIYGLESRLQLFLPDAYKEFLLWGGKWARGFLEGSSCGSYCFFEDLLDIQEIAVELLEDNQFAESLPPDAFVFFMHQGYFFRFFKTSEGNNPPIYSYLDGQALLTFKNEYPSYSNFLENELELSAKFMVSNTEEKICRALSELSWDEFIGLYYESLGDEFIKSYYEYLFEK